MRNNLRRQNGGSACALSRSITRGVASRAQPVHHKSVPHRHKVVLGSSALGVCAERTVVYVGHSPAGRAEEFLARDIVPKWLKSTEPLAVVLLSDQARLNEHINRPVHRRRARCGARCPQALHHLLRRERFASTKYDRGDGDALGRGRQVPRLEPLAKPIERFVAREVERRRHRAAGLAPANDGSVARSDWSSAPVMRCASSASPART